MPTLTFADHKASMIKKRDQLQFEWQCHGGDGTSHTLYFYIQSPDSGKCIITTTEASNHTDHDNNAFPTKAYEWTGVGSVVDALTAWRGANGSVDSGGMYNAWEDIDTNNPDVSANKAILKTALDEIIADIPNVQALIDADPDGSIEV